MKRFIKTFALITTSFFLTISFVLVCNAQVKSKRKKQSIKPSKTIVAVKAVSPLNCNSYLVSQNTPRPDIYQTTSTTEDLSDCVLMDLTALNQPKHIYPKAAVAAGVSSLVSVDIVIDEEGKVIWAEVLEGHSLLRPEALRLARQTRFKPTVDCLKRRVKRETILYYNFILDKLNVSKTPLFETLEMN